LDAYFALIDDPPGNHSPKVGAQLRERPVWVVEISNVSVGIQEPLSASDATSTSSVVLHHGIDVIDDPTGLEVFTAQCP
jgi:hypothetical protein